MKVSKLYSTSIAAALLSTTILTGVASAADNNSTSTTPGSTTTNTATGTTTTTPTAKQSLESAVEKAKTELTDSKTFLGETDATYKSLAEAITKAESLLKATDTKDEAFAAETKSLTELTGTTKKARVNKTAELNKARSEAKRALNQEIEITISTASKPTKLVAEYSEKKAAAKAVYAELKSTTADYNKAKTELTAARETVVNSPKVIKLSTGIDGKLTINFKTLDGRTDFPKSTGKLTSTGVVTAEKGTDYIEVYDLRDLTKKYQLTLPQGFEINNPDKVPANAEEITNIDLKQTPGYQFDEALVTFTLKRDGQVIKSAIPSFTVLQETGYDNRYSDVTTKLTDEQLKDIKAYYLKEGYIVNPSSKFTFNKESFYQTAEINYIKKPEAPAEPNVIDGPDFTSFNGSTFNAGSAYTLPTYLYLYEKQGSNILLDKKQYKIELEKVSLNKKDIKFTSNKFKFTKVGNYIITHSISAADGSDIRYINKSGKVVKGKSMTVTNTATVVDSAPVISGIKSTTYSKKTFSYTKGIKAYDYVDKKYVKVTYKGKVNPSKKGKYKIYYSATDSKGNTAKKTRYVVVK
ncbi:immunoglobulin-like domain-containing protein [Macrococcoides bohemicum]|uniref:immunoglobulin-like domain-containing protein n=1 Tax=Macrococcoides bohemicum TaxID=1903056 RepID=UPI00165DE179|nr:immunoglobulin-like domain-containing protein [Macrococcus bohemicus]MBC9873844.1 DUF5011 domain-containing protein [Macrococcus bohemicus]